MQYSTVQEKFNEIFSVYSENTAILYGSRSFTYRELDEKSDIIAANLISGGITKGTFIGVLYHDKAEIIVSMLGILKAGCVFVPLDPAYPAKRLEAMVNAAQIRYILIDSSEAEKEMENSLFNIKPSFIVPERDFDKRSQDFDVDYQPDDSIYVYFTSGSTGEPKAIIGRNKGLRHFIDWEIETFGIDESFKISQFTSQCHDPYLRDVFVPLFAGGKLCIPEKKEIILDTRTITEWIENTGVNLIHCTPSLFKVFNKSSLNKDNFKDLKYILLAGEKVPPAELANWYGIFDDRICLVNMYGPTETTLAKFYYIISPSDTERKSIPIGKPISGAKAIILDGNMKICNRGVMGEIYIRTPFMSLGYYNNEELNSQKFIRNPFGSNPDDKIYKTGDLGRIMDDDNFEFLGRVDRQVKIRGFRVELSDIENNLYKHRNVGEAVVADREGPGGLSLNAYIVPADPDVLLSSEGKNSLARELDEFLSERLMDYMIPQSITILEKIPLTPNGKIDYKALPLPEENSWKEFKAPGDEIELKLSEIWCEILGIEKVGVDVDFLKAGGHSLNAMSLIARIHQEFEVELPLGEIFKGGTIEKLAQFVKGASKSSYESIEPLSKRDYYDVSQSQERLWTLYTIGEDQVAFNIPKGVVLENLNRELFEKSIYEIMERHEILRTTFVSIDGEPRQIVHDIPEMKIRYVDLRHDDNKEATAREIAIEEANWQFDLVKGPLHRIALLQTEENSYIFLFTIHHIIADAWSMGILMKELITLYTAYSEGRNNALEPLKIQYKDFAAWQNELFLSPVMETMSTYWRNVFNGPVPVLKLPTDFQRPAFKTLNGSNVVFEFDSNLTAQINSFCSENSISLFMLLMASFYALMYHYSGQDDIVIGTPVAGRENAELENQIGFYLNILPLRMKFSGNESFMGLVEKVRNMTLEAFKNQAYPFDRIINDASFERDTSRSPLFDVMVQLLNVKNEMGNVSEFAGVRMKDYETDVMKSKYDIVVNFIQNEDRLQAIWEYNTDLFKHDTIQKMVDRYKKLVLSTLENPALPVSDIEIESVPQIAATSPIRRKRQEAVR